MKNATLDTVVHALVALVLAGLMYVVYTQGNTITEQRSLIREMQKQPSCVAPVVPPSGRRGRFV